jgi:hypothetical protein
MHDVKVMHSASYAPSAATSAAQAILVARIGDRCLMLTGDMLNTCVFLNCAFAVQPAA